MNHGRMAFRRAWLHFLRGRLWNRSSSNAAATSAHRWQASTRSKLVVLRSLDTEAAADSAAIAWNRLSRACHVHAFELQPSAAEVKHLCGMVASLL